MHFFLIYIRFIILHQKIYLLHFILKKSCTLKSLNTTKLYHFKILEKLFKVQKVNFNVVYKSSFH